MANVKNALAITPKGQQLTACTVTKRSTSKRPQVGQFNNNDDITAVAAGAAASSKTPLLQREPPNHLSLSASRPVSEGEELSRTALHLLRVPTFVAPLHLVEEAWHLVEVQEAVT